MSLGRESTFSHTQENKIHCPSIFNRLLGMCKHLLQRPYASVKQGLFRIWCLHFRFCGSFVCFYSIADEVDLFTKSRICLFQ